MPFIKHFKNKNIEIEDQDSGDYLDGPATPG